MGHASLDPRAYMDDEDFERESADMVHEWMTNEASHGEMTAFLAVTCPDRFFGDDGMPDPAWLDDDGVWMFDEVFNALFEGRSMKDSGNLDAFDKALARAEEVLGETVKERLN